MNYTIPTPPPEGIAAIKIDFTENKCRYAAERLIACGACHFVIIKFDKIVLGHKFFLGLKFNIGICIFLNIIFFV